MLESIKGFLLSPEKLTSALYENAPWHMGDGPRISSAPLMRCAASGARIIFP